MLPFDAVVSFDIPVLYIHMYLANKCLICTINGKEIETHVQTADCHLQDFMFANLYIDLRIGLES